MARGWQVRVVVMDDNRLPALWGRATTETLSTLTGAHHTTARRWKRLTELPRWLAILVRVVLEGELADVSAEFAGWCIRHGELVSPEGVRFTPGQIRALPFRLQQVQAMRARERVDLDLARALGEQEHPHRAAGKIGAGA